MSARSLCQHCLLRITGLWLAMPFLLMSLMAPGYMPVQGADGGITMVICSGDGPVTMILDPATGAPMAQDGSKDGPKDGRCSWAQAAMAVADLAPTQLAPPVMLARAFVPVLPDGLWRPAFDPRGLFARGPPATV